MFEPRKPPSLFFFQNRCVCDGWMNWFLQIFCKTVLQNRIETFLSPKSDLQISWIIGLKQLVYVCNLIIMDGLCTWKTIRVSTYMSYLVCQILTTLRLVLYQNGFSWRCLSFGKAFEERVANLWLLYGMQCPARKKLVGWTVTENAKFSCVKNGVKSQIL